jgi:colanic acid/amylovoran biosynthesis protein
VRFLIESSNANFNWGDASMLHTAIRRVVDLCSDAQIELLKPHPAFEKAYEHAGVQSVNGEQRKSWRLQRPIWHRLDQAIPGVMDHLSISYPRLKEGILRAKMNTMEYDTRARDKFLRRFEEADALLVSGGGFITDLFRSSERVLNIILLARSRDTPVYMFGQGIGPIRNSRLWGKAKRALPEVRQISLREKKFSRPILQRLGVSDERISVTGDDAVALAYDQHPQSLGECIGVNLRVAYYSEVSKNVVGRLASVLSGVSASYEAPLLPVPIAYEGEGSDVNTIRAILNAAGVESDGGRSLKSPEEVIGQAGDCRVVVTGSYHGGVFALSQGVPVVGLSNSEYYDNKFHGLADMFGAGCTVVRTERPDFETTLDKAVRDVWEKAPEVRNTLLSRAEHQIDAADSAYERMFESLDANASSSSDSYGVSMS